MRGRRKARLRDQQAGHQQEHKQPVKPHTILPALRIGLRGIAGRYIWLRLRAAFAAQKQAHQGRYHHEQHDGSDQHAADDDRRKRALDLTADAG